MEVAGRTWKSFSPRSKAPPAEVADMRAVMAEVRAFDTVRWDSSTVER
ncbi:hypothetical protein [Sulfodiicoccus acidiphilus]|nr:hypothetical protein [Sulfodiicoccus acidiphilus]